MESFGSSILNDLPNCRLALDGIFSQRTGSKQRVSASFGVFLLTENLGYNKECYVYTYPLSIYNKSIFRNVTVQHLANSKPICFSCSRYLAGVTRLNSVTKVELKIPGRPRGWSGRSQNGGRYACPVMVGLLQRGLEDQRNDEVF